MSKQKGAAGAEELSRVIVKGMQEKKAENIVVLDLRNIANAVADFFVICSGNSDTHIEAIAESIDKEVSEYNGEAPWHREGLNNKTWVLLDYIDVVAHVFSAPQREFYNLESLWGDALISSVEETAAAS